MTTADFGGHRLPLRRADGEQLLEQMFASADRTSMKVGSEEWSAELFKRAYMLEHGPFESAVHRLRAGFSTLVYLPGNCMRAASSLVRSSNDHTGNDYVWTELFESVNASETLEDLWKPVASGALAAIGKWLKGECRQPGFVFYNLDFLADSRNGVYPNLAAQTAALGIVESARRGVVFGMSDRDEPELPPALARAFTDRMRIDEIPYPNFHRVMPMELGRKLKSWNVLHEGTISLLASRLRWTDPLRAYLLMVDAMKGAEGFDELLQRIVNATSTVEFVRPQAIETDSPRGFRPEDVKLLERHIIRPFQRWKGFRGSREDWRRTLEKLPPGAILHGPPGTGKTHLARWIAQQIDLPVRVVSGGDLRAAEWGQAERNVQTLFRDARRAAPCVLILDDADDLLPSREEAGGVTASAERAVVNEFLQQLQGMRGRLEGVLVILTTNRFRNIDPAAQERLPLHLRIPYPTSPNQVAEIIRTVAEEYGYLLTDEVNAALIDRFYEPRVPAVVDPLTAESNRFSPREIRHAMRMLEIWDGGGHVPIADAGRAEGDHRYVPTLDDVRRVLDYYRQLTLLSSERSKPFQP